MAASAARVQAQPRSVSVISRARASTRVAAAPDVAAGEQLVHQLGRGLPGDAEVLGQLGDGRAVRGEPGEREAVRGTQVIESAGLHPGRDPVHQGPARRQ